MHLYHVPAKGTRTSPEGIQPDFPPDAMPTTWGGHYDEEAHEYIIRSEEPVPGLEELEIQPGDDVGFDYSMITRDHDEPVDQPPADAAAPDVQEIDPVDVADGVGLEIPAEATPGLPDEPGEVVE